MRIILEIIGLTHFRFNFATDKFDGKQPLSLTIEKEFAQNSERVKSVDQHPTEPWILVSLYSGTVCIWNYQSQTMEKSFKVTESPVRSAKFIARENWIVTASDDKYIRVYNYDTMEKIKEYEAHTDFIRSYKALGLGEGLVMYSDFEGHSHYVMQVAFNPKDTNTFASASLDGTIKIWNIGSPTAEFTLDGHSKGVNCIDYFSCGDKPYLLSGSDDFTAKVWDIETKSCVQTLEGHEHNVTAVCVHAELPIIITVSEDGNVHIWNATTFR
ncbi:coatomer subunit beta-2 [Prunus yedoensis var. nudiflora]|uniref:Coatomer subunit beta-2 n=1 Tax=Prunus yedoensis var. nudiflora TaxID=2094558 RepID=A0A314Y0U4_PRUYE|nr:coatomer subunit beta-2 [Prunus yedoensis var. nudiflora]